ncbi:hypothetical protein DPEC_G00235220 [Dallia pectoralis]|uniref:Uncharacterized protein n=1 Tax=Dallia pectoralis TaxID=75939 RepID=A0ACC2FYE0_DALPE|nr:hypothetical protein DPEC_G00235220 [Dallia pectoralis]
MSISRLTINEEDYQAEEDGQNGKQRKRGQRDKSDKANSHEITPAMTKKSRVLMRKNTDKWIASFPSQPLICCNLQAEGIYASTKHWIIGTYMAT